MAETRQFRQAIPTWPCIRLLLVLLAVWQTSGAKPLVQTDHSSCPPEFVSTGPCQYVFNPGPRTPIECLGCQQADMLGDYALCPLRVSGIFNSPKHGSHCHSSEAVSTLPSCEAHCCSPQLHNGTWKHIGETRVYHPAEATGCTFHQYSALQRNVCLEQQRRPKRIVIAGDSMMRQFVAHFVATNRQAAVTLDIPAATHMRYLYCREADLITFPAAGGETDPALLTIIADFFKPVDITRAPPLHQCSRPPLEVVYLQAATYASQPQRVTEYLQTHVSTASSTDDVILILGYPGLWEPNMPSIPAEYLSFVEQARAQVSRLFVFGTPTARIPASKPELERYSKARNAYMADWLHTKGMPDAYIDFDTLSLAWDRNKTEQDWHFMCAPARDMSVGPDMTADVENYPKWPHPFVENGYWRYTKMMLLSNDPLCQREDMNAMLWSIVYNVMCNVPIAVKGDHA